MRTAILAILLVTAVPAFGAELLQGICTRVIDGDTIVVRIGEEQIRVRLFGIDCPERNQPFGREAGQFTRRLVLGKLVVLEPVDTDRYKRMVAWVSVGEVSVNRAVLQAGMGWWYKRYAKNYPELGVLESQARDGCRGLWCMCGP